MVAPARRRQVMSSRLANVIGMILVPVTILWMVHPATPEEWFVIYAIWLIGMGGTFFSFGANAGILYLPGCLCFLLAVIAPLVPFYMPLVVGSLMSLNLTTLGLLLRRVYRGLTEHSDDVLRPFASGHEHHREVPFASGACTPASARRGIQPTNSTMPTQAPKSI